MKVLIVDDSKGKPVMKPGDYPDPEPGDHDLLVKIRSTALNRVDLLQKAGKYPVPESDSPIPGLEMAGVVEQTGDKVTRFRNGDRVFGLLAGGGYAEKCVIHEDIAMPMPDSFGFEEAAAIPEVSHVFTPSATPRCLLR